MLLIWVFGLYCFDMPCRPRCSTVFAFLFIFITGGEVPLRVETNLDESDSSISGATNNYLSCSK